MILFIFPQILNRIITLTEESLRSLPFEKYSQCTPSINCNKADTLLPGLVYKFILSISSWGTDIPPDLKGYDNDICPNVNENCKRNPFQANTMQLVSITDP